MSFVEVTGRSWYRLLHPQMAVLIGSSDGNRNNFMTAAWVMPVSANPPLLAVAIAPDRYTHELIEKSGEFTVNVMDMKYLEKVHYCGVVSGREEDKVSKLGLTVKRGRTVSAPVIEEATAVLECRVWAKYRTGDHTLFIGEVKAAYVKKEAFKEVYDIEKFKPILHMGKDIYVTACKR